MNMTASNHTAKNQADTFIAIFRMKATIDANGFETLNASKWWVIGRITELNNIMGFNLNGREIIAAAYAVCKRYGIETKNVNGIC